VELYEWTGKEWIPYEADDVQVQFFMMSPYVLQGLKHNGKVRGLLLRTQGKRATEPGAGAGAGAGQRLLLWPLGASSWSVCKCSS